ncbi:MAG: ABC transporter permease [Acidobacteriota bacterium]
MKQTRPKVKNSLDKQRTFFWLPVWTLLRRELIRFWREKSRVLGFVAFPLVFWLAIGSGFGDLAAFFPGALTLTVMFSAVFSMMSLIEDRREGFLLSMLVSPAPRLAMVLGKVTGASLLAWMQGVAFLLFLPVTGLRPQWADLAGAAGVLFLIAFAFTGLGFLVAWKVDSTQGFHALVNLLLFPLWMVSGALFPAAGAHGWMRWLMRLNPLSYSLDALRGLLDPRSGVPNLGWNVALTAACGVALLVASAAAARRTENG